MTERRFALPSRTASLCAGLLCALSLLGGCAHAPADLTGLGAGAAVPTEAALDQTYADLARAGGQVIRLDPAASSLRIYVFRGGRAGKLGHNHVLSAPRFTGLFCLPASGAQDARFDLLFRLDALDIDNAAARAGLGSAFASVVSPEAIQGTREHMLGPANLQAAQFPTVYIHALKITGEVPRFAAQVQVVLHGVARTYEVPLAVEGLPAHLAVRGSLVLRQTDFGIAPFSVMNGLLAVEDAVVIDFDLRG
jgi:hypothetical protein